MEMSPRKETIWKCLKLLIYLVVSATLVEDVKSQESIYAVFRIPKFSSRPRNLASNFKHRNRANIPTDIFIDSTTVDPRLANLVVKACSRKNALVVSSPSKTEGMISSMQNVNTGSKLRNLILVYESASNIDLGALKTRFADRWNPRARVLTCVERMNDVTALEMLEYFWKYDNMLNVALTILNQTSALREIFTYNPFVPGELPGERGRIERLDPGISPFPDKLKNLHNITIPISVFQHLPKVSLQNFTILKGGADVEVLYTLSKKLNFTGDIRTAPVYGTSYTVRLANGEQVGMIGDVLTNRSEIVFNAQYIESTIGRPVEFTQTMLQTGYCVLVPKAKVMPMIVRMLLPFPKEIWIAVMTVVGFLFISLTLMGEKNKLTKIFELLLHQTFAKIAKRYFNRLFLISCIVWAYLMACFYQARFMNELIHPKYYKDIDTLEELYDSNLPLIVGDNMLVVLNNSEIPVLKKLAERSVEKLVFTDCLNEMLAFFNVSCALDEYISVIRARYHKKEDGTPLTHSVKECLSLNWDVYVAKNGFPFLDKFNQLILSLLEAGLYKKWVQDLVKSQSRYADESKTANTLTLKHFEGVFAVLALGLGVSTLVFILELVVSPLTIRVSKFCPRRSKKNNHEAE